MLAEKIDRLNRELWEKARQEGYREGFQEGYREGYREGLQEGEARILLRQLRLKFGPLGAEIEELVHSADADRLLEWSEQILTAERLQDVFQD